MFAGEAAAAERIPVAGDANFIGPIKPDYIGSMSESWGDYLTRLKGPAPEGMIDPHAHHALFQNGNGVAQKALVSEGQEILREVGIDPIFGPENLGWAPNRVASQHSISTLRPLVEDLRAAQGSRADIEAILRYHGDLAAQRR